MGDDGILIRAALAVRYYLPGLVDDPERMDAQLLDLLNRAGPEEDIEEALADVLASQPTLQEWTAAFIEAGEPPGAPIGRKGHSPLPGHGQPVRASRYVCPVDGKFDWYRRSAGQEIPFCKDHQTTVLVLAQ